MNPILAKAASVLTGYAVPIIATLSVVALTVIGWQHGRIGQLIDSRATVEAERHWCKVANKQYQDTLRAISEQHIRRLREAEAIRQRAEDQARRHAEAQREANRELEKTRRTLAQALAGNACAADPVPADVARLFNAPDPSL